jgi:hypothetical protein
LRDGNDFIKKVEREEEAIDPKEKEICQRHNRYMKPKGMRNVPQLALAPIR